MGNIKVIPPFGVSGNKPIRVGTGGAAMKLYDPALHSIINPFEPNRSQDSVNALIRAFDAVVHL